MAKKNSAVGRELVLTSGKVFPIISETDRYYVCEITRFRKSNRNIAAVRDVSAKEETINNQEEDVEEAPGGDS